jgi:chromate transporter
VDLLSLVLICVKVSFLSFGGSAPLPLLHDELGRRRDLLPDADFASAIAIGRIAPGPNGLFVLPIGYFVAGVPGALVAAAALWVVSMPVLILMKAHHWLSRFAAVEAGLKGIQAGAIGLTLAMAWAILLATTPTPFHIAIAVTAFVLVAFTRVDVLLVLAGAALLGLGILLRGHLG